MQRVSHQQRVVPQCIGAHCFPRCDGASGCRHHANKACMCHRPCSVQQCTGAHCFPAEHLGLVQQLAAGTVHECGITRQIMHPRI
eukprot:scaffold22609_cov20-Tisochrysis_lutea.AAC.4